MSDAGNYCADCRFHIVPHPKVGRAGAGAGGGGRRRRRVRSRARWGDGRVGHRYHEGGGGGYHGGGGGRGGGGGVGAQDPRAEKTPSKRLSTINPKRLTFCYSALSLAPIAMWPTDFGVALFLHPAVDSASRHQLHKVLLLKELFLPRLRV